MKFDKVPVLLLIIIVGLSNSGESLVLETAVAEATEIIGVVRLGVSLVEYMYKVFAHVFRDSGASNKVTRVGQDGDIERRLLAEYRVISDALDRLGHGYETVEASIHAMQLEFSTTIRRELRLDRVDALIRSIWASYNSFEYYQENKNKIEKHTLNDFATNVISHSDGSIRDNLEELHALVVPEQGGGILGNKGVITLFANGIKDGVQLCNLGQSPHQIIYNLYNIIALTEIKGYAMVQFAYMIMRLQGRGNFTFESELAKENFEERAAEKLMAVKAILPHMSRNYWRCDPMQPIENDTYIRITNLLQGHIENEIDMSSRGSCRDTCSSYTVAESQTCYKSLFCAKQKPCRGRLFDCEFYDADAWVCLSQNQNDRRYDWIEYEDGTRLGNKNQCINKIKVDSWWRWLFWHCSYCLCKCDEPGPSSDRYWSLKQTLSTVGQSKIVTGVRFVKRNRIIHIEIQQAEAKPEGIVKEEDREWLEAPNNLNIHSEDVLEMSYEVRSLDMDMLEAPNGHVITGLRFRNIGGHINLEAKITPIAFKTGKLDDSRSTWIGNDNTPATENRRTKVSIVSPDVPTKYKGRNAIDSVNNQFVSFDSTTASKDVAQTTIPYIDSQNVAPNSGVWITGIGLYHKGHIGYGGYVGFVVKTFDFSTHLLPDSNGINGKSARLMAEELKYDFTPLEKLK